LFICLPVINHEKPVFGFFNVFSFQQNPPKEANQKVWFKEYAFCSIDFLIPIPKNSPAIHFLIGRS
jgi:hypothetical protein